jgi:hypothetical protein
MAGQGNDLRTSYSAALLQRPSTVKTRGQGVTETNVLEFECFEALKGRYDGEP